MNQYDTSLALVAFRLGGVDPDLFLVYEWSGQEAISELYRFEVKLASAQMDIKLEDHLGRRATLTVRDQNGRVVRWHGLITALKQTHRDETYAYYQAVLEPQLALLRLFKQSRVYLHAEAQRGGDPDLSTVIRDVLEQCGLKNERFDQEEKADFEIRVSNQDLAYTRSNFICQFEETSLNFLQRRLEHAGVYFWFEQGEDRETIVFANAKELQPKKVHKMVWRVGLKETLTEQHIAVKRFEQMLQVQPKSVVLRDFSVSQPDLNLTVKAALADQGSGDRFDALGQVEMYGAHFSKEQQGEFFAEVRSEELQSQRNRYEGEAVTLGLQSACLVEMTRHFRPDANAQYLVLSLKHRGKQSLPRIVSDEVSESDFYQVFFVLIPVQVQYRPPLRAKQPRVVGFVSAIVMAEGEGEYAELNQFGCYKVQFLFAPRASKTDQANSAWVRMATPYAGSQHGLSMPLLKGTEVLVSFLGGNPDRPVIVSAIPNEHNPSLLNEANTSRPILRTAGQNELEFEDREAQQYARLFSPFKNSTLQLGADTANPDFPGVRMATQGNMGLTSHSYIQDVVGVHKRQIGREGDIPVDPELEARIAKAKAEAVANILEEQAVLPDASVAKQLKALAARLSAFDTEIIFLIFLLGKDEESLEKMGLSLEEIKEKIAKIEANKIEYKNWVELVENGELDKEDLAEKIKEKIKERNPEVNSEEESSVTYKHKQDYISSTTSVGYIDNSVDIGGMKNSVFLGMTNDLKIGTEVGLNIGLKTGVSISGNYAFNVSGGKVVETDTTETYNTAGYFKVVKVEDLKAIEQKIVAQKINISSINSKEFCDTKEVTIADKSKIRFLQEYQIQNMMNPTTVFKMKPTEISLALNESALLKISNGVTHLRHINTSLAMSGSGLEFKGVKAHQSSWNLKGGASGLTLNGRRICLE